MNKTKEDNQNIAKAILKIRQENRLSQEQFAEKIGVTRQAVSRWEMGISTPNINTLILLSEKFNISIDALLKADEPQKPLFKNDRKYGISFLVLGILGFVLLPFLSDWYQKRNMELFKTAYEHAYNYIFEYPLCIVLVLSFLFVGMGIYFILKKEVFMKKLFAFFTAFLLSVAMIFPVKVTAKEYLHENSEIKDIVLSLDRNEYEVEPINDGYSSSTGKTKTCYVKVFYDWGFSYNVL